MGMISASSDRRCYELCALSELKNALRPSDIWMKGSRQFKDFEDYVACGKNAERTELNAIGRRPWIWARRDSLWRLQSFEARSKQRALILPR
jgi:hypothetical protein